MLSTDINKNSVGVFHGGVHKELLRVCVRE